MWWIILVRVIPTIISISGFFYGASLPKDAVVTFGFTETGPVPAMAIMGLLPILISFAIEWIKPAWLPAWNKIRSFIFREDGDLSSVLKHLTAVQTYGVKVGCDKLIKASCDMSEHCASLAVKAKEKGGK